MRISMISTLPPIKGLSPYTLGLMEALSKKCMIDFYGFKSIYPEFLYPGGTKTEEREPKRKNLNVKNYLTWYNPLSWVKVGFSIKTKVLHVQWWSWFLAPVYLTIISIAKLRRKRIIMTLHNIKPHEKSFVKNFLNNSVIGFADEYIVHNEENKKQFVNESKTKKTIHVIPHGIIGLPKTKISSSKLRKKYGFSKQDKILLFFGNIRDYKGLDTLIKSLSYLSNNVKLIIAGKPWESFDKYQDIIDKLNLKHRVTLLLGFNSDKIVSELFKLSDLIVYPYNEFEASSGSATVALGYGKPIVVTNVGGLSDLVIDKNVIAKENNTEDLKEKIIYAIKNLNRLKKDSKEKSKTLSWDKITKKTIGVYRT